MKRDLSWLFILAAALFLVAGFLPLLRHQRVNTVFVALAAFWTILGLAVRTRGARGSGDATGKEHGPGDS